MIDQQHINLMNLINQPLRRVGNTGGGEYHGACPWCGGKDRFIVQPNDGNGGHWWCRQCERRGDAVGFVMQRNNLDFRAACEYLRVNPPEQTPRISTPKPAVSVGDLQDYPCFNAEWQKAAYQFAYDCTGLLWDTWETSSAARYLEARGIDRSLACADFLGVNPEHYHATWGEVEVKLPRGITIPWEIDYQQIWNVRVRRPNGDVKQGDKYISAAGCANGMYRIYMAGPGCTVVMTEGEFDAILLDKALRGLGVRVVSIGTNTGGRVLRWLTRLSLADRVLLAFDDDAAGNKAADYWSTALLNAERLLPTRKDITEMWMAGESLVEWVQAALKPKAIPITEFTVGRPRGASYGAYRR